MSTSNSYLQECPPGQTTNIQGDCITPLYYNRPGYKVKNWTSAFSWLPGVATGDNYKDTEKLCNEQTKTECIECPSGTFSTAYYYPPCQQGYRPLNNCSDNCILNRFFDDKGNFTSDTDDLKNMQYEVSKKYSDRIKTNFVTENTYKNDSSLINSKIDSKFTSSNTTLNNRINGIDTRINNLDRSFRFISGTEVPTLRKSITGVDNRITGVNTSLDNKIAGVDTRITSVNNSLSSRLKTIEGDINNGNIVTSTKLEQVKTEINNSILQTKQFTTSEINTLKSSFTAIETIVTALENKVKLYNNILQGTVIPGLRKDISNRTTLDQVKYQIASDISDLNIQYQKLLKDLNILRSTEIPNLRNEFRGQIELLRGSSTTKEDTTSLKTQLSQLQSSISSLNTTNGEYKVQINQINNDILLLKSKINEYDNFIKNLQGTIIPGLQNQNTKQLENKHDELKSNINTSILDLQSKYDNLLRNVNIIRGTEIPSLRKSMEELITSIDSKLSDLRTKLTDKDTKEIIDINSLKTELLQSIVVAKGEAITTGNDYTKSQIVDLETRIKNQLTKIDDQIKVYNNSILGTIIPGLRNDHRQYVEDKNSVLKSEIKNSINELGKYYDNIMRILYNASTVFNPQNSTFTPKY